MSALKTQDQGIITLSQQDYLAILIESFLIDRRSQGLSAGTIDFLPKSIIRAGSMPASGLCEVFLYWVEDEEIRPQGESAKVGH